jgi:endonuclease/exonuclease/phosphatase family metal-dependent hydrolase
MSQLLLRLLLAIAALSVPTSASAKCKSKPLLAMTYNIRLDTSADGTNAWVYRKSFLIGQIAALRPELLGLQEVLLNQKRDLEAAFPAYRFLGAGRDDGKDGGEFSPLAVDTTQFQIGKSGTFWLSQSPTVPSLGWDAGYKRLVTWARLTRKRNRARILVLNTHWDHQGLVARRESGKQILDWLGRNRKRGEQLILLGDFNAEATEESIAQLTSHTTRDIVLFDARQVSATGSTGPTFSFNAFNAFPASGKLIDHIFVGAGVGVRSHAVIAQHENGRVASDHFPIAALLEIPSPGRSCVSAERAP